MPIRSERPSGAMLQGRRALAGKPVALGSVFLLLLAGLVASCTVKLISDYDEQIDAAATQLQQEMDLFLSSLLQSQDRSYAPSTEFYVGYAVKVRSVRIRASTHEKNRLSIEQYDAMLQSLETLRALHENQNTLSDGAIQTTREQFNLSWTSIISLEVAKKRGGG